MKIPIRILMERYQNHLYRIAFSICQNREDAEDVVQDTFLQYHILKKEFEDETHIRAWLMRVAINKSRNIVRAFWRKLGLLWSIAETFNGLMVIPNLIAVFLLSGVVVKMVKDYFNGIETY